MRVSITPSNGFENMQSLMMSSDSATLNIVVQDLGFDQRVFISEISLEYENVQSTSVTTEEGTVIQEVRIQMRLN